MALELKNISKTYHFGKQEQVLFKNLNIVFPDTGMIGIVGDSGCGKSTLLNIISGDLKSDTGEIIIDNKALVTNSDINKYQKDYCVHIYQNYCNYDFLDGNENIEIFNKIKDKYINDHKKVYYLDKLGMTDVINQSSKDISGGQGQRLAVIRALLTDCPILLADEPTGALNSDNAKKVLELLKMYSKTHLVIIISHDYKLISNYVDEIIDFKYLRPNYIFGQRSYLKYRYQFKDSHHYSLLPFIFKQLIDQRVKIFMIIVSQIFSIFSITLLTCGLYGLNKYYDDSYSKTINNNQITIIKTNHKIFNSKDKTILNNTQTQFCCYNYNLNLGNINNINCNFEIISPKPKVISGNDIIHNNEILINKHIKGYHVNDILLYTLNNQEYSLKIVGNIDDGLTEDTIYFDPNYLDKQLIDDTIDKSILNIYLKDYRQVPRYLKQIPKQYQGLSYQFEQYQGNKTIINLLIYTASLFILISIIISIVLVVIIINVLIYENRKHYAILLSNGLSRNRLYKIVNREVLLIILSIFIISILISGTTVILANLTNISYQLFSINNMFIVPNIISKYDLFLIFLLIDLIIAGIVSCFIYFQIVTLDITSTLKEE